MKKPQKMTIHKRYGMTGWLFLLPASILICIMSFIPIAQAFGISLQTGIGSNMTYAGLLNYQRMAQDNTLHTAIANTLVYMIQVPIMLGLALWLAALLNQKGIRFKGLFRVLLFLPCATASVSYSLVFRIMFASDGMINTFLVNLGILETGYNFFGNPWSARLIILLALVWRWTGYNMVFLLAALQNIDETIYESAVLDGASEFTKFTRITLPLIRPTLILLCIMTVNGTIQLYDESVNLTGGGPANTTLSISHYIYNLSFKYTPNFGYSTAIAFVIFLVVAILSLLQMKVGDKRD